MWPRDCALPQTLCHPTPENPPGEGNRTRLWTWAGAASPISRVGDGSPMVLGGRIALSLSGPPKWSPAPSLGPLSSGAAKLDAGPSLPPGRRREGSEEKARRGAGREGRIGILALVVPVSHPLGRDLPRFLLLRSLLLDRLCPNLRSTLPLFPAFLPLCLTEARLCKRGHPAETDSGPPQVWTVALVPPGAPGGRRVRGADRLALGAGRPGSCRPPRGQVPPPPQDPPA